MVAVTFIAGVALFWLLNKIGDWFGTAGAIIGGALTGLLLSGIVSAITAKYPPPPAHLPSLCQRLQTC